MREAFPQPRADEERRRAERRARAYGRHAEPGWFEWMLREFCRYLFALGVLALLLLGVLQMAVSWLPSGRPPVLPPAAVAGLALALVAVGSYVAFRAYAWIWSVGGFVDRYLERLGGPKG